jgi:hypothetical protein
MGMVSGFQGFRITELQSYNVPVPREEVIRKRRVDSKSFERCSEVFSIRKSLFGI